MKHTCNLCDEISNDCFCIDFEYLCTECLINCRVILKDEIAIKIERIDALIGYVKDCDINQKIDDSSILEMLEELKK